jgi:hypothetical protein
MINLDLTHLLENLRKKKYQAELQKKTNQIYIVFNFGDREFPLFIRIFEEGELLQLLAFIPCNMKEDTLSDTARLLHLLNKELDIPGFGMEETAFVIFYRCMLPAKKKQIDEELFDAYLNSIQIVCKSFAPIIAAIAYGASTFEDILKKTQQSGKSLTQTYLKH